jgi:hypothetical protein
VVQQEPEDEPAGPLLVADPLPVPLQAPVDAKAPLPLPVSKRKNTWVNVPAWYPWLPSPMVVMESTKGHDRWDVWNVQSTKQVGTVPRQSGERIFLSPDGSYAGREYLPPGKVTPHGMEIFQVADGKLVRKLPAHFGRDTRIGATDFIGPDRFLALHTGEGRDGRAKVWDVKTGDQLGDFTTHGAVTSAQVGVSPGGRYLATCESHGRDAGVYLYELPAGKMVRKLKPHFNPPTSFFTVLALAFSYDGKELALLVCTDKQKDYLQAWDFATGKRTVHHHLNASLVLTAKNAGFYRGAPFEWLPDDSGWLAYGQLMIDRRRGHIFWKIPPEDPKVSWQRRFVDGDHLVTVLTQPAPWHVGLVTLPRDQIEAARKR